MRHSSKLKFVLASVFSAFFCYIGSANAEGTLNVYNWAEYIGEDTIANFEAEYGIDVTYDNYDSVETVDAKLLAGNTGYDVVSHSGSAVAKLIPTGVISKLDTSRLSNLEHMSSEVMARVAEKWDPNNDHFIPYMLGNSWSNLQRGVNSKHFSGCPNRVDGSDFQTGKYGKAC